MVDPQIVVISYTNWRGTTTQRTIIPRTLFFGTNEWHPERQWLLTAFDVGIQDERTFAMRNIHSWKPQVY